MRPDLTRRDLGALLAAAAAAGPALAAPPVLGRQLRIEKDAASTGWLDFDFYRDSQIYIPAQVNGVAVDVFLDSGVSHLIIDRAFAGELQLGERGAFNASGLAGRAQGAIAEKPVELRLGPLTLSPVRAYAMDLSLFTLGLGRPFRMMLGREVFEPLLVDIDFPSRKIAFHDPRRFSAPHGAVAVPLVPAGHVRSIPVSIEGLPPIQATFDIGNSGALDLSPRYAARHKLLDGKRTSTSLATGIEGENPVTTVMLSSLGLAGVTLRDVPAVVHATWRNDERNIAVPANIGIQALRRFRVITDYRRDRLWLVPNPAALSEPFRKNRVGLRVVHGPGHLKVTHVSRASPAEAAGFTAGDEIVAVGGRAIDERYVPDGLYRWMNGDPGTAVEVALRDGSKRRLTLADYY